MPIIMVVIGLLSATIIVSNVNASTPVTLKTLRVDDEVYKGGETIKLPTGKEFVVVDATPTDEKAVIEVTGENNFVEGENTLTIKVTGSDGKNFKVYTLTLIKPKLEGWCQANAEMIATVETNYQDELLYEMPGYAELGTYAADIKAHPDCFTDALVTEVKTNY